LAKGFSLGYPPTINLLILYFSIDVKKLFELGKKYPWIKPYCCPACKGHRLWGHGYAPRYFEEFSQALWMKRFQCPDCTAVHCARPETYTSRFRYRRLEILRSLTEKISGCGKWLALIPRQNQQYWFKAAKRRLSISSNVTMPTLDDLYRLFNPSSLVQSALRPP
jgi:hypothetical protein